MNVSPDLTHFGISRVYDSSTFQSLVYRHIIIQTYYLRPGVSDNPRPTLFRGKLNLTTFQIYLWKLGVNNSEKTTVHILGKNPQTKQKKIIKSQKKSQIPYVLRWSNLPLLWKLMLLGITCFGIVWYNTDKYNFVGSFQTLIKNSIPHFYLGQTWITWKEK